MNQIAKPAAKASTIKSMQISIDITLSRALSEKEQDQLEAAGISVYGECAGPSANPRYALSCHDAKELGFAHAFLAKLA